MFGVFRVLLALWVMLSHLLQVPIIGHYAVFAFFVLSGFLMTTIMQETYGYNIAGLQKYLINRFLRLYPLYWVIALLTILLIIVVPESYAASYKSAIRLPSDIKEIFFNITMIYPSWIPWETKPRLSPPTWALTVEIFFYICIGLGISKTKKITFIWLIFSIFYFLFSYHIGLSEGYRYAPIIAGSLPFSLGAISYHFKPELLRFVELIKLASPIRVLTLYFTNTFIFCLMAYHKPTEFESILILGKYLNLVLAIFTIIVLFYKGKNLFNKRFDKIVGDYSYTIYLSHWQCGLLASFLLFKEPTKGLSADGVLAFFLALLITCTLSTILITTVDKNVSKLRNKIKQSIQ